MSRDFWFGMFSIPAAAAALAIVAGAFVAFIWWSERFDLSSWKLWPKRTDEWNQLALSSVVACAKSARYLWIPGWHIVICRTTLARKWDDGGRDRHRRVRQAIRDALRESESAVEREQ